MRHYLKEELYELIKTDNRIFDFLQEGAMDGLWYWDLENPEHEWMNNRFWEVLGYDPEKMPHKASAWQDIINQDDLNTALENFNQHLADPNHPYDQEVRYTHKNGSIVWVRCRGKAIRDKNGKPIRMLGVHQDITALKQAEEKMFFLNKSISNLIDIDNKHHLFEYFTSSVHSLYSNAIFLYVSIDEKQNTSRLESISGIDNTLLGKINKIAGRQILGKQFRLTQEHQNLFRQGRFIAYEGGLASFAANEFPAAASNIIKQLLKVHQIYTIGINRNNKLLGALHILSLNGTEITDGDFLEIYANQFSSVLENLNSTTKLKESEEKFRTIFEHAPIMIDAFDASGKCVLWNNECKKILGYTIDEVNQAENPLNLFYQDDKTREEVRKTIVSNPDKKFREWSPKTKNGLEVPSMWANFKVSKNMIISIGVDISNQKRVEKRIKEKNQQLETIIKGANLGWWDWDIPSGDEIYNETLAENLGYKLSEITPHINWWEGKIHPDDSAQVTHDLQEHFQGKTTFYSNKHRLVTKTGEWKWFHDHGRVVKWDENGKPIRMIGTLRDIDYEERAKEQINASLEQIKIINANTPNIIWKWDVYNDGSYKNIYISDAVDQFLAQPEGSFKNDFSSLIPKFLPIKDELIQQCIKTTNKPISFEYEVKKADGNIAWFSSTGKVIQEKNKLTVYGSTIDITEKKHAEAALEESETRFKALHNASFGGITIHDKGVILECNNGLSEITGYTIDELIGMDGLLLIAQESRDMVREKIASDFEQHYEAIGERKNGEKYPLRLEAREIPYKGKDVRVVEFRDISEQKEAENKLKESEEMLRNIFENSTSVIYSHDTDHLVNYVSPQVEEVLGFTQEEAKVMWQNLLSDNPINEIAINSTVQAIKTGKQQLPYELEFKHKNGTTVLTEVREAPVVKNGKTVSIVGILNDITERKQNELELLKAKEKAEESDRLKSAFLSNMSHEIRTPMNGILGFTELLKEPNLSGERKDKYIEIIRKSGDRMLDTVNDIIDISKIDAGQMEVSEDTVNIKEEVETHYEFFRVEAAAKGIEMKLLCDLNANETTSITDKNKLNSIVSNLIKNAIKYTDDGTIEVSCHKKKSTYHFKVTDTGIGIPKRRIESIFNRFEQADIGDTHAREGSGLGLAITKAYVEMLGGKIGVDSIEGKGSSFYFSIPWVEDKNSHERKRTETVISTSGENNPKILIAEDDDISFEHLEVILFNVAKKITRATDGNAAIEIIKQNPDINLVLMDIKMPGLDGLSATKEIRKFNKEVVIIAQTANALEGDREKAIAAGCNDYITKPIDRKTLIELIALKVKN